LHVNNEVALPTAFSYATLLIYMLKSENRLHEDISGNKRFFIIIIFYHSGQRRTGFGVFVEWCVAPILDVGVRALLIFLVDTL
jgi:hypothetical protein